jgi:hypothetical protein
MAEINSQQEERKLEEQQVVPNEKIIFELDDGSTKIIGRSLLMKYPNTKLANLFGTKFDP